MTKKTLVNEVEILDDLNIGKTGNNGEAIFYNTSDDIGTHISSFSTNFFGGNLQANKKIQLTPMTEQVLEATDTIASDTSYIKVSGDGGAITLTSLVQIATGTFDGQVIIIRGMNNTNILTIVDGNGVSLADEGSFELRLNSTLMLLWNGSIWIELSRSKNDRL